MLAERGMKLDSSNIEGIDIPNYVVANDGKHYKFNMEINGIYYCPGNVIIDHGEVIQLESEKEVLMDYFILDKEKKTLRLYDSSTTDSFLDSFENIVKIEMVKNPDKEKKTRLIKIKIKDSDKPVVIEIDKDNNIVGYENQELKQVGKGFLRYNYNLRELNLPLLEKVEDFFLEDNEELRELYFPNLKKVGNYFLSENERLSQLNIPLLEKVGDGFLYSNTKLREIYLPKLKRIDKTFLGLHPKRKQLISNRSKKNNNKIDINLKDIVELDTEKQLTTTEVSLVRKIIEKIKSVFHKKDSSQR